MNSASLMITAAALFFAFFGVQIQANEVKDYSKGFEKFLSYGLPDVKDAEYGRVSSPQLDYYASRGPSEGNAWLLKTKPDGTQVVLVNGYTLLELQSKEDSKKALEKMASEESIEEISVEESIALVANSGEWKSVDLKADIQKILSLLEKAPAEKDPSSSSEHTVFMNQVSNGEMNWAQMFIQTCHFYRKGYVNEANRMAAVIFEKGGDSRKVLQSALNQLADAQYNNAFDAFRKTGDWKEYDKAMEVLINRYSTSWKDLPVIQRCSAEVKQRIAQAKIPPLTGKGLSEEDQQLAQQLAADRPNPLDPPHFEGLWIFDTASFAKKSQTYPHALNKIRQRGIQSLPLLIALLTDKVLTHYSLNSDSFNHFSSWSSSGGMTPELLEMQYAQMKRPATRGEIAAKLLGSIQSNREEFRFDPQSPEQPQQEFVEWYATVKGKTEVELLQSYLEKGDPSQKYNLIESIIKSKAPEKLALLEKAFLESQDPGMEIHLVMQYVEQQQGANIKPFVDKYLKRLRDNPQFLLLKEQKHLNEAQKKSQIQAQHRRLSEMETLVSGKSFQDILAELHAYTGKWSAKKWQEKANLLRRKLPQEDPNVALSALLQNAINSKDLFLTAQFLTTVSQMQYFYAAKRMRHEDPDARRARQPFDFQKNPDLWKKLLEDERRFDSLTFSIPVTVGQLAGSAHETLFDTTGFQNPQYAETYSYLQTRVYEILRQRALARRQGKKDDELPGWPQESAVTKERKEKLISEILSSEASKITGLLKTLNNHEFLVVAKASSTDTNLNLKLLPSANVIYEVSVTLENNTLQKQLLSLKGKTFDTKTAAEIVQIGLDQLKKNSKTFLTVSRLGLDGLFIRISDVDEEGGEEYSQPDAMELFPKPTMYGQLYTYSRTNPIRSSTKWEIEAPAPAAKKPEVPAKSEADDSLDTDVIETSYSMDHSGIEKPEEFMEAWAKILGKDCPAGECFIISLTTFPKSK